MFFFFRRISKHFFERGIIPYIPNRKGKSNRERERERKRKTSIQSRYHFSMDNEEVYCAEQFVSHNYLTRWPRGDLRRASWNELERALENCQKRENSYPWQWGVGSSKCQHGYRYRAFRRVLDVSIFSSFLARYPRRIKYFLPFFLVCEINQSFQANYSFYLTYDPRIIVRRLTIGLFEM